MIVCFITPLLLSHATAATSAFISLDAIEALAAPGQTQNVSLLPSLGNTYQTTNPWQHDETVMFGIGLRSLEKPKLNINTSLRFLPHIHMQTQGDVLQLYSPAFRNLAYRYDITSHLLFMDNIIAWTVHRLQPGLILGLGGASNTATHYREFPLSNHAAPSLDHFRGNTQLQFMYEVGAALDYTVKDIIFECAYRFMDAGHAQLGLSPLQNTTDHLTTGRLQYHTISLGVRLTHEF